MKESFIKDQEINESIVDKYDRDVHDPFKGLPVAGAISSNKPRDANGYRNSQLHQVIPKEKITP